MQSNYTSVLHQVETDISLRGISDHTIKEYVPKIRKFLEHIGKPVEEISELDFRTYLEYLNNHSKLAPSSINVYNSAIRFFFEITLEKNINYKRVPRKKDPIKLPVAFTTEEISAFIDAIDDIRYKAIFTTIYASGLRISEIRHLRVKDIDSNQMRLFIYQGKGKRDRWVPLAHYSLMWLRDYFKEYKPNHPNGYLFLNRDFSNCISERSIQDAFKKYHSRANIQTYGTVHTLRHSYATHQLENGVNVFFIQKILGHATLWTTMRYLRISLTDVIKTKSPLDTLYSTSASEEGNSHDWNTRYFKQTCRYIYINP